MKRRKYLKSMAAVAGYSAVVSPLMSCMNQNDRKKEVMPIGINLFYLPKLLEEDFGGALRMLSQMGYKELELYGPYSFSTASAKAHWSAITPMLGFSGSGFFGKTSEDVRSILDENGLRATAAHTDLDTLVSSIPKLAEAARAVGFEYVVLPAIPPENRKSLDDYKRIADTFNQIGTEAKREGIKFAYHNHGYGLQESQGLVPLKIILDNTDPALVFLEMDIFWTTAGGADPVDYLKTYSGRYRLMHLKNMSEKTRFNGDGGDPGQWIELFPKMTTAGSGVLDLERIIEAGIQNGVEHFYIEQDMVASPKIVLKEAIENVKALI